MGDITKRIHEVIFKVPYQVYILFGFLALLAVGQSVYDYNNQDTSYSDYLMARDLVVEITEHQQQPVQIIHKDCYNPQIKSMVECE